jgi:signal transduction histidine kinase
LLDERLDRPVLSFLMAQGPEAAGQPATGTQTGLVPAPPMQRWRVPAADHGSEIQFRNALWSRYRVEILLIAAALCLQTGLIAWLIIEHRRRQRAELQSRNAMAELTRLDRRAGAGALSASIAHEVSQPLAAISARTGAALRWLRA